MLVLSALLLLLAVMAIFASQNAHMVAVNFLGWHFTWPLAGVVLITLVAGGLAAFLIGLFRQVNLRLKIYDTSGRLRKAETELVAAKTGLDKNKAELDKTKAEFDQAKTDLDAARRELEEARQRAPGAEPGPDAPPGNGVEGGGPGGTGGGRV